MTEGQEECGTRWRVVGLVMMPVLAALLAVGTAVASGALAVSFVAQSGTLGLATSGLKGEGFGIAGVSVPTRNPDGSDGRASAARIGVASAQINGLCIAQPVQILGKAFTLLVRGGDGNPSTYEIKASGLLMDLADAKGVITTQGNLAVNKNAADVRLGASGLSLGGSADRFGLQSDGASLRNIVATVRSVTIPDLLTLPSFSIKVVAGTQGCPVP